MADAVIRMPGFSKADATREPLVIGKDGYGYIVRWFYPDLTLTMHRRPCGPLHKQAYCVKSVRLPHTEEVA